ncbi:MAG: PKD domain-containing protein [Propioniciclava sp.]|uniref:PKD domain-containing protein n=1 Tax=Propioniciclava sp. TaxID=2038686 RepID=UPI0039E23173
MTDQHAAFDASTSQDSDGTIVSYLWDFGDGTSGSGASVEHDYATPGAYTVVLTVTDDRGGVSTYSLSVVATAPNQLPTADFTTTADYLNVDFDASGSQDADGTLQSYSWAFGDGSFANGVTARHTFAAAGNYEVTLTVTDDRGGASTVVRTVKVVAPPNQVPSASFATHTNGLALSVDGSASSDPDGSIASYAWDFGDGSTGSGAQASHTYAASGTFIVTLKVTDDDGAESVTTRTVTVNALRVIAADGFERSVASGWGSADVGGAWVTSGGAAAFSVADGAGKMLLQPSWTREAMLPSVQSTSTRSVIGFSSDTGFAGGTQSITLIGRKVGSSVYGASVRIESGGVVRMHVLRDTTALAGSYVIPGYSYRPGDVLNVSLDVTGTNPTKVAASIWVEGTSVPSSPQLVGTDSTAALQVPGSVGVKAYSPGPSTSNRVLSFKNYQILDPNPAAANVVPVASFTSSVDGLAVSVDGSASSDPDGSIASYAWDFGDGSTGTGAQASHTYGAAGTFTVRLTVTDNAGATHSVTESVTVKAPPAGNVVPVASFTSSVDGLAVSVDGSASSDPDGSIASYAWDFGDGATGSGAQASHTYAAAGTFTVRLTVTDNAGATHSVTESVTVQAPASSETLVTDGFERSVASGWGSADVGGAWVTSGGAAAFSVADGAGKMLLQPSWTREAMLPSVQSTSTRSVIGFSSDTGFAGGTQSITLIGRKVGSSVYGASVRIESGGVVRMHVLRDTTALAGSYVIPGYSYRPGDVLNVSLDVTGTNPTKVAASIWVEGTSVPTSPQLVGTDSTAALQVPGSVGVKAYSPGPSTSNRVLSFKNYQVRS